MEESRFRPGHDTRSARKRVAYPAGPADHGSVKTLCNLKKYGLSGRRHDDNRHRINPAVRGRSPRATAASGDREHSRHDDRVVRFPALQHRYRARLREALLPQIRPVGRGAGGLRGLYGRLYRPADRGGVLRAFRRPHRAQGGADRHPFDDWIGNLRGRLCPDLRNSWHLGGRHPDDHPLYPGDRGRRRMGRLGAVVDGMGAYQPPPRLHYVPRYSYSARSPATNSSFGAGASRSC